MGKREGERERGERKECWGMRNTQAIFIVVSDINRYLFIFIFFFIFIYFKKTF